jgi:acyl carrier protein
LTTPVSERVIGIASDVFGLAPAAINANSSPENVESWDSTQHLNFILALEEIFELQLSPEETEKIRNIGQAIQLIEEKLQATCG